MLTVIILRKKLILGFCFMSVVAILNLVNKSDVEKMLIHAQSSLPNIRSKSEVLEVQPSATNRTSPNARVLFYNKVPKCGSSTMNRILRQLGKLNKFSAHSIWTGQRPYISESKEAKILNFVSEASKVKSIAYNKHVYFLNWTRHQPETEIVLINMVREPVDRMISMYHFIRSPAKWPGRKPDQAWQNKTLEQCVLENDQECKIGGYFPIPDGGQIRTEMQLTFFCGQSPQCSNSTNEEALNQAKHNLETHYSVVGLQEEFDKSIEVMEAYMPGWFHGATKLYADMGMANTNPHSRPEGKAEKVLRQRFRLDIEFYQFARQRFDLQLRSLGMSPLSK